MKNLAPTIADRFSARAWTLKALSPLLAIATVGSFLPASHAQTPTLVLSNKWSVAAGTRTDLSASGDNTRGIAINKTTGNVLWSTRGSGGKIYIISGADGSDVAAINTSGISLGAIILDQVRVADDGVIYAGNLQGAG